MDIPTVSELIGLYLKKADELEAKAKDYRQRASALKQDLEELGVNISTAPSTVVATNRPQSEEVTVEQVRAMIAEKGGRISHIAKWLGTSEKIVTKIVTNTANGIRDKGRGWLTVVELTGNEASGATEGGE